MTTSRTTAPRRALPATGHHPVRGRHARGFLDRSSLFFAATLVLIMIGVVMVVLAIRSAALQRTAGPAIAAPVSASPSMARPAGVTSPATSGSGSTAPAHPPTGRTETSPETSPEASTKAPNSAATGAASVPAEPRRRTASARRTPVAISIPTINIKTSILKLGLAADHTVEVPPFARADEVGWYTESPIPGAVGPSILIGHVDSPSGPAVFADLADLAPGDRITIGRADGSNAVFAVDLVGTYPKNAFPTRAVYGNTKGPTLRLITCGGSYDRSAGGYQSNVIAFAHLVSTRSSEQ